MKSIANIIHQNNFPLRILDARGNNIYCEDPMGYWLMQKFDSNDNMIYYINSNDDWLERTFSDEGNLQASNRSEGFWHLDGGK